MEPVRLVVLCVDLGEHSREVIHEGLRSAEAFGAEVSLVHVVHELESMYGIYLGGGSVGTLQADIEGEARARLHDLCEEAQRGTDVRCREVLLKGVPWSEIVGYALHERAGRIVLGAHVSKKPEHKIVGSTAERVLRNAPCPVLVVPPAP